jgi:hypothetical protein
MKLGNISAREIGKTKTFFVFPIEMFSVPYSYRRIPVSSHKHRTTIDRYAVHIAINNPNNNNKKKKKKDLCERTRRSTKT